MLCANDSLSKSRFFPIFRKGHKIYTSCYHQALLFFIFFFNLWTKLIFPYFEKQKNKSSFVMNFIAHCVSLRAHNEQCMPLLLSSTSSFLVLALSFSPHFVNAQITLTSHHFLFFHEQIRYCFVLGEDIRGSYLLARALLSYPFPSTFRYSSNTGILAYNLVFPQRKWLSL